MREIVFSGALVILPYFTYLGGYRRTLNHDRYGASEACSYAAAVPFPTP